MRSLFILLVVGILSLPRPCPGQNPAAPPTRVANLDYFLGTWECAGKFVRSGAKIEARLEFEFILDKSFLFFRHDDKPPHNYHAWAEWGWDDDMKQFVSTVQDSSGSTRWFHSGGWQGEQLVWEGGALPHAEGQRFTFEKQSPQKFQISYAVQKEQNWISVDTSTCTRVDDKAGHK